MPTARTRANRKYNEKTYERISVVVKKGEKNIIKSAADAAGESMNEYIRGAVEMRMEVEAENPQL